MYIVTTYWRCHNRTVSCATSHPSTVDNTFHFLTECLEFSTEVFKKIKGKREAVREPYRKWSVTRGEMS